jgi:hypothetical protein
MEKFFWLKGKNEGSKNLPAYDTSIFQGGGRHYNPSQQTFSLSKLATPRNLEWDSFLPVIRNIEDMV